MGYPIGFHTPIRALPILHGLLPCPRSHLSALVPYAVRASPTLSALPPTLSGPFFAEKPCPAGQGRTGLYPVRVQHWSRTCRVPVIKDPLHNAPQSPHHICVYYYCVDDAQYCNIG